MGFEPTTLCDLVKGQIVGIDWNPSGTRILGAHGSLKSVLGWRGVSRQISGLVITTSVTSRRASVIFNMAAKSFRPLTERYLEISNYLMTRLLCSTLLRIANI